MTVLDAVTDHVGTQVGIERDALRLLARPDVRAAVATQAERWRAGTPGLLPETYDQLGPAIEEVALLVALQVADGDPRRPEVVEISAGPHTWGGLDVPGGRWGINNPDTLYFAAPLEPGSGYVLRGRPLGGRPTDVNVSVQTPDVWGTLDSLGRDQLTLDAEGGFVVSVGGGPDERRDDHLPIKPGGTVLLVRQTLADWSGELPYALSIERTSGPDPEPPLTDDQLARRLVERLGVVVDHSLTGLQPPVLGLPANTVPQPGPAGEKPGYLVAQRNTLGHFRLADDEALVLVLSPGGAGYAAVAAPGLWGVTADSARHQNSLNDRQAAPDPDGRITLVVANTDPGVANWVDPGGRREGIVMLRWQRLDEDPDAGDEPGVTARLVRAADLPDVLPPGTPRLSPEERQAQLAARRAAYGRRFAER